METPAQPMPSGKKWLIALGIGAVIGAVWAGVIFFFGTNPRVEQALTLIDSGKYLGHDEAYFTDLFGPPASEDDPSLGAAHNVAWPLTDSITSPLFFTVIFDASGHAVDATVHGY